jgi:hypothetical protein
MIVKIPEGMVKAARVEVHKQLRGGRTVSEPDANIDFVLVVLDAALRWWQENPIVPTEAQVGLLQYDMKNNIRLSAAPSTLWAAVEWQRRMFNDSFL